MVSVLDSRSSLGLSLGWGHYFVFLSKTIWITSHGTSRPPQPGVQMGTVKRIVRGNPVMDWHPIQGGGGGKGGRNVPIRFVLQKPRLAPTWITWITWWSWLVCRLNLYLVFHLATAKPVKSYVYKVLYCVCCLIWSHCLNCSILLQFVIITVNFPI